MRETGYSSAKLRPQTGLREDENTTVECENVADILCGMNLEGRVFLKLGSIVRRDLIVCTSHIISFSD